MFKAFAAGILLLFALIGNASAAEGPTILIWWADFGYGHRTAAYQLASEIQKQQPEAKVVLMNAREFMRAPFGTVSHWVFDKTQAKAPRVYGMIYKAFMSISGRKNGKVSRMAAVFFDMKRIHAFAEAVSPDAWVDAWYNGAEARIAYVNGYKGARKDTPHFVQVTDWLSDPRSVRFLANLARHSRMTGVPMSEQSDQMAGMGIDPSRMTVTGIPTEILERPAMTDADIAARRTEARERIAATYVNRADKFLADRRTIMIEGGLNGAGRYTLMIASLALEARKRGEPLQIVAATGKNREIYRMIQAFSDAGKAGARGRWARFWLRFKLRKLKKHFAKEEIEELVRKGLPEGVSVFVKGKLDRDGMSLYRNASDLIISKPGALSMVELVANRHVVFVNAEIAARPSQESENIWFLSDKKVVFKLDRQAAAGPMAYAFLDHPGNGALMGRRQELFRESLHPDRLAAEVVKASLETQEKRGFVGKSIDELRRIPALLKLKKEFRAFGPGEALKKK